MAVAALLAACGGSSSDANQPAGTFHVKVVTAQFPTEQRLGQTSLLRIGVRNTGKKTVPALTVTVSIAGKEGQTSSLPFGIHDPSPASPSPTARSGCWRRLPAKLAGSSRPGGATTSNRKTFDFGPLKPGATTEGGLEAERGQGRPLHPPLQGRRRAQRNRQGGGPGGVAPGGSFAVKISSVPPNTAVTDSGEVVEIGKARTQGR